MEKQKLNLTNIEQYTEVEDKYIEFVTRYFQTPGSISKIYHEQLDQLSNQIKSLDAYLKDTHPTIFAQYVLLTSHFRSVKELEDISIKITTKSVYYTAFNDLVFLLTNILHLDSNDRCPVIVIPSPVTTHYIQFGEEQKEPSLIKLTCSVNGKLTQYWSYNYYFGANLSTTIFSRGYNPETTSKAYPNAFFKVIRDGLNRVQYPETPITPEALREIKAPISLIDSYTQIVGKYNHQLIGEIIKNHFGQIVKYYP